MDGIGTSVTQHVVHDNSILMATRQCNTNFCSVGPYVMELLNWQVSVNEGEWDKWRKGFLLSGP